MGVHAHLIFEVLAYSIGFRYYVYLRKRKIDTISDENRLWIFIGATAGGFLGAHLLGILERPENLQVVSLPLFMSNKTILGGLLFGLFAVEITKILLKVKTSSGDLMTFPLILGMMIGRIGCFLEGLEDGTYGIATTMPWGVDFGDHIKRHPTQLYEIVFLACLWLAMIFISKYIVLKDGQLFKIFLISYFVFRFSIEFIKPNSFYILGLCAIQIACLIGLFYYFTLGISKKITVEKR